MESLIYELTGYAAGLAIAVAILFGIVASERFIAPKLFPQRFKYGRQPSGGVALFILWVAAAPVAALVVIFYALMN